MSQTPPSAPQQEAETKAEPGSLRLSDPDREKFCQELVATGDLYASFEAANFKRPRGNAQRLLRELDVAERVGYLYRKIAPLEEALLLHRRHEHRRALEHIATADRLSLWEEKLRYVTSTDKNGKKRRRRVRSIELKPLGKLTDDERALIDGFKITDKGAVEVLIPKRLDARAMLAKLDGLDAPTKIAPTNPAGDGPAEMEIRDPSSAELARRVSWLIEQAAAGAAETRSSSAEPPPQFDDGVESGGE